MGNKENSNIDDNINNNLNDIKNNNTNSSTNNNINILVVTGKLTFTFPVCLNSMSFIKYSCHCFMSTGSIFMTGVI